MRLDQMLPITAPAAPPITRALGARLPPPPPVVPPIIAPRPAPMPAPVAVPRWVALMSAQPLTAKARAVARRRFGQVGFMLFSFKKNPFRSRAPLTAGATAKRIGQKYKFAVRDGS
jgi:hypothetical protein